jgi:hypothetical protein
MQIIIIKQGGTAEAALKTTNRTIDSKTKILVHCCYTLAQGVEMAVEHSPIGQNFINLRGRDFRGLNSRFVSRQGASLSTQGRTLPF